MEPEDPPPDPNQVDNITSIETARMTLRWALERLRALEKTCAEQENRAETEATLRLKAEGESETLRQGQRELYYKKLEEFIALHLAGKLGLPTPALSAPIAPPPAAVAPPPPAPAAPALEPQRAKAPPHVPQPDERRARTDKGAFTLAELEGTRAFARLADVARALKGQVDRLQAERAQSDALAAAEAARAQQALDESLEARRSLEKDLLALRSRPNSVGDGAGPEDPSRAERETAQARQERDKAERGRELAARDLADARQQRDQARRDLEQARRNAKSAESELADARQQREQARRDLEQARRSAETVEHGREMAARDLADALQQRDQARRDLEQERRNAKSAETVEHGSEMAARDLAEALQQRDQARSDLAQARRNAETDERPASVPAPAASLESERAHLQELERRLARQFAEKRAELEGLKKQFGEQIERWLAG